MGAVVSIILLLLLLFVLEELQQRLGLLVVREVVKGALGKQIKLMCETLKFVFSRASHLDSVAAAAPSDDGGSCGRAELKEKIYTV